MKKAPKVLTRMRLSCCWGDNLNVKELNDVVDYINELEQQCKKQKEAIDKVIEYMTKTIEELECDDVDDEEMKGYLIQRIDTFKEILLKFKEIIGVKDEKK